MGGGRRREKLNGREMKGKEVEEKVWRKPNERNGRGGGGGGGGGGVR